MEIINNGQYRVVCYEYTDKYDYFCISTYKVQVKVFWFWITIKEFEEGVYDDDADFCRREAIELYNKIINPYGEL